MLLAILAPLYSTSIAGDFDELLGARVRPVALVDRQGYCEILHGEAGGVEDGDVLFASPTLFLADEHTAKLDNVPAGKPAVGRRARQVAVVARLLRVVVRQNISW
jgi:hypothetical protein